MATWSRDCWRSHPLRCPSSEKRSEIMENATMGKVLVSAKFENLSDLILVEQGHLPANQVRSVEVADAVVDTGASTLSLPKRLIAQLGLHPFRTRQARTARG